MEVKGTAFVARRAYLERKFGPDRFDAVLRAQAAVDPVFASPILATSRLPIEPFLRLNDRIVRDLYRGDERSYVEAGVASAEFALSEGGPYRTLVVNRDVASFAASAPRIYRTYYDEGDASSTHDDASGLVTLALTGIPIRHVYFEHAICGYFGRGLEMVSGKRVESRCVRGFSKGDADVLYEYRLR
jgi:hypothetical protein